MENFVIETGAHMSITPPCPQCSLQNTYPDGPSLVCADCGHEWPAAAAATDADDAEERVQVGTKVKSIRLVGGDHEVDCKMDAGSFMLKACYLRKV